MFHCSAYLGRMRRKEEYEEERDDDSDGIPDDDDDDNDGIPDDEDYKSSDNGNYGIQDGEDDGDDGDVSDEEEGLPPLQHNGIKPSQINSILILQLRNPLAASARCSHQPSGQPPCYSASNCPPYWKLICSNLR